QGLYLARDRALCRRGVRLSAPDPAAGAARRLPAGDDAGVRAGQAAHARQLLLHDGGQRFGCAAALRHRCHGDGSGGAALSCGRPSAHALRLFPLPGAPVKIYVVGGAVRDELLGRAVKDRDYVVVGATPEEMVARGFKPVGKDFPVFLHPDTAEEHALARTERKTARGYTGFQFHAAPDVTLEQDLARRDLTITALARDEQGNLIDPYGGLADLRAGILRPVSPAFLEDPVRVPRGARSAARIDFPVAPETMALMREMAHNGEVDALVPERVWQEYAKGLMETHPVRMFEVLRECEALLKVLPEWAAVDEAHALAALRLAADADAPLAVRYAVLWFGVAPDIVAAASERLRAPNECRDLA